MNILIIDFNEGASDQMFFIFLAISHSYNLIKWPGNDSLKYIYVTIDLCIFRE